ncbi:hypothetical protein [Rhodococcus ruber]|uniref:hypothetical protein n=1 Tax=Rhodococcus ruber TaxID=1830 RepID=UPI003784B2B4
MRTATTHCTCAGTAPGYPQHEAGCGTDYERPCQHVRLIPETDPRLGEYLQCAGCGMPFTPNGALL